MNPEPPSDAQIAAYRAYQHALIAKNSELFRRAWCAVHGEAEHVHRAVCVECAKPLGPDLVPNCAHPATGDYVRWRCWEGLNA